MEEDEFKKTLDLIIAELDKIEWKAKKKLQKAQELKEYLQKYDDKKADANETYSQ